MDKTIFDRFCENVTMDGAKFGASTKVEQNEKSGVSVKLVCENPGFPTQAPDFKPILDQLLIGMENVKRMYGVQLKYETAFKNAVKSAKKVKAEKCDWNKFLGLYAIELEKEYKR